MSLVTLVLAVAFGVLAGSTHAASPPYVVVDLGTLGGTYSVALAMNASGQVVGNSATAGGAAHAVLWQTQVDASPPVVTPHVTGTLGSGGWYVSDVGVSWTVSDPESEVTSTSGCDPSSVTADTSGVTFTCSATDGVGLTSVESVTIKRDATPPSLTVPAGVVVDATSLAGAVVVFVASASDGIDASPTVVCAPASGSVFAIGGTTVSCTAADAAGNTASAVFVVHVRGAADQLAALRAKVASLGLRPLVALSLDLELRTAQSALAAGRPKLACAALDLFVVEVRLLPPAAIQPAAAADLITAAKRIEKLLGCTK